MSRGASIHLQAVTAPGAAAAHNSRAWTAEHPAPKYLLPPEHSLGHWRVIDGDIVGTHAQKMALASAQAKRDKRYSPVYEGVLNLDHPTGKNDREKYDAQVQNFCKKYEEITGHKVIAADVHLDEGRIENGQPIYNAHAHIVIDRTDARGRVMKMYRTKLRQIQDAAAESTGLVRGDDARQTKRQHLHHSAYRNLAKSGAILSREDREQSAEKLAAIDEKIIETVELYGELRGLMKASGTATQTDYQEAKKQRENREWIEQKIAEYDAKITPLARLQDIAGKLERSSKNTPKSINITVETTPHRHLGPARNEYDRGYEDGQKSERISAMSAAQKSITEAIEQYGMGRLDLIRKMTDWMIAESHKIAATAREGEQKIQQAVEKAAKKDKKAIDAAAEKIAAPIRAELDGLRQIAADPAAAVAAARQQAEADRQARQAAERQAATAQSEAAAARAELAARPTRDRIVEREKIVEVVKPEMIALNDGRTIPARQWGEEWQAACEEARAELAAWRDAAGEIAELLSAPLWSPADLAALAVDQRLLAASQALGGLPGPQAPQQAPAALNPPSAAPSRRDRGGGGWER